MRILWIIEGDKYNPNYKIAIKVAKVMAKNHEIYLGLYSDNDAKNNENDSFIKTLSFGEVKAKKLYFDKKVNWRLKTRSEKIKYICIHPKYWKCVGEELVGQLDFVCEYKINKFCKENNIEAVIGTVFPYKIGKLIQNLKYNVSKYIFQLDPYVNNYTLPKKHFEKRKNNEIAMVGKIDKIFTTSLIKKEMMLYSNIDENKIVEIEFPAFSETYNIEYSNKEKSKDKIIFLHAGTFYEDIRNPKILVSIFEKLPDNYFLMLAGFNTKMIHKYDNNIRDRIIDVGLVTQEETDELRKQTDVLISFNNLVENQVPSKLFECIQTGKPLLNICQLDNCPTLPYVDCYDNACTIFVNNIEQDKIINFVGSHLDKKVSKEEILKRYKRHTYEYVADQIEKEIIG